MQTKSTPDKKCTLEDGIKTIKLWKTLNLLNKKKQIYTYENRYSLYLRLFYKDAKACQGFELTQFKIDLQFC